VTEETYCRTININGRHGLLEVLPDTREGYLSMTLHGVATAGLFETVQRARELFDLGAPVGDIAQALSRDSLLAEQLHRFPGPRVPGAWDGFELAVRAILGQQVSVAAASTLCGRIAARYGEPLDLATKKIDSDLSVVFPTPARLARARFNGMGLTGQRAATIRALACAVADGRIDFDFAQDPQSFHDKLTSIKGIGDWTAQYVAMRVLKNPDAFPASDLGLRKSIGGGALASTQTLNSRAEAWRPWRAYAAMLLWNSLSGNGG
jgi:AraC family transcriptional regulator of adaptative response / DNA-3-methyladenine glycosylase II